MDHNSTSTLIYLDDIQAGQFVLFQKYFLPISLCLERRVFENRAARVILEFDKEGVIVGISRNDLLYLKNKDFINTNPNGLTTLFGQEYS